MPIKHFIGIFYMSGEISITPLHEQGFRYDLSSLDFPNLHNMIKYNHDSNIQLLHTNTQQ